MTDLEHFEALVENARWDYAKALKSYAPGAVELFRTYWELQRDYNYAWTADARERLEVAHSQAEGVQAPDGAVLMQVLDEEYNEEGLMLKYFVDRAKEAGLTSGLTEDDFWQIVAGDGYLETRWVAKETPSEALEQINALLLGAESIHELAAPSPTAPLDSIDVVVDVTEAPVPTPVKGGRRNIEDEIARIFIEQLEAGVVPWHKPWATTGGHLPLSMSTAKAYRGTNSMLLGVGAMDAGYTSPFWGTFNQIKVLGGSVNKGEHGTMVIFYKGLTREETNEAGETMLEPKGAILKAYKVFNACQTTGLPEKFLVVEPDTRTEFERIAEAEAVVEEYLTNGGPKLVHGSDRAYYSPSSDRVVMPELGTFETREHYYSTLFHELGHSTGHESRLSREGVVEGHRFGDEFYSREELIAEMTAAMSCAYLGLDQSSTVPNSAAYLGHWVSKIREDPSILMKSAAGAQKACDAIGLSAVRELAVSEEVEATPEVALASTEEQPAAAVPSLTDREESIRNLQRYVRLAGSEKPEALAEGVITDEMCQLRSELAVVTAEGGNTVAIDGALEAAQRKLDILTGRTPNLIAFNHFCSAVNKEHADDAARLEEEQAVLEAYRASVLDELSATPELSPEVAPNVGISR